MKSWRRKKKSMEVQQEAVPKQVGKLLRARDNTLRANGPRSTNKNI